MSRKKSRRRSPQRNHRSTGHSGRFLRALVGSAAASFTVASCALHPQLLAQIPSFPALDRISHSLPDREAVSLAWVVERLPLPAVLEQLTLAPFLQQAGGKDAAVAVSTDTAGSYVQTRFSDCLQLFPDGHTPLVPAAPALRELCYDAFAILHSGYTRTPILVVQRLNRQMLQRAPSINRTDRFFADARLPAAERAELDDYRNSGWSRGHLAPAGDMHTEAAMMQSFTLANMVPQDQRHNAGAWNTIENDTRKYILRARGDVHVFTGAIYAGELERIGGRVAVPTHLYKLVYDASTGRSWAHWQANSPDTLAGKPISYDEFVLRTGMRLLPER